MKIGKFDVDFEDEDEDDWGSSNGCRIMGIMYDTDKVTFREVFLTPFTNKNCLNHAALR